MLLDGKALRDKLLLELKEKIDTYAIKPILAVILVGHNPASELYVKNKQKVANSIGIETKLIRMPDNVSQECLLAQIDELNKDTTVTAILVQLPLPEHMSVNAVIDKILPKKDVDCFTNENLGRLYSNNNPFIYPCTPKGIVSLIDEYNIDVSGKKVVVIGRSNIVGKPIAHMLSNRDATVTLCHSKTQNLTNITRDADIVVTAVGKTLLTGNDIKNGAVVINVGQYVDLNGKICGDIDFESVSSIAGYVTPIVGGTGPMTILSLMQNTLVLFELQNGKFYLE